MSGALFTLLLLVALCADSLPNETLIPMAVVLVVLALVVAVAGHKKTASDAATSKAVRPKAQTYTPLFYRGNGRIVKHER